MTVKQKFTRLIDLTMSDMIKTLLDDDAYGELERRLSTRADVRGMFRMARFAIMSSIIRGAAA